MAYTLQIGGAEPKPLAALGIASAVHTEGNLGASTLALTTAESLGDDALIPPYTRCILRHCGTVRWVGWLDKPARAAEGGAQRVTYVLDGPMRWLAMQPYKVHRFGADGLVERGSGIVTLGQRTESAPGGAGETDRISMNQQIADVVAYAASEGGPVALSLNIDDLHIPWERRLGDSCASVLAALLGEWSPGVAAWWTYGDGDGPFTLNIREGAGRPLRTLDAATTALRAIRQNPRFDDLCRKVEVIYIWNDPELEASGFVDPTAAQRIEVDDTVRADGSDADVFNAPWVLSRTIELGRGEEPPEMLEGMTISKKVAETATRLQIEAEWTVQAIDWGHRVGDRWTWAGILNEHSGSWSVAQTIRRDLFTESEQIKVGPPRHLGIDSLLRLWRRRNDGAGKSGPDGSRQPTNASGQGTGSLVVTIETEPAISLEARWIVSGFDPQESGDQLDDVPAGNITVTFSDLPGDLWITPDPVTVEVLPGEVAEITVAYAARSLAGHEVAQYSNTQVRVGLGTFNGLPPEEFNTEPTLITGNAGFLYYDTDADSEGEVTGDLKTSGSDPGSPPAGHRYDLLAWWTSEVVEGVRIYTISQAHIGNVEIRSCRNWYSSSPSTRWSLYRLQ